MRTIQINKNEVLRYMGNRGDIAPAISNMVDKHISESGKYLAPRHVARGFDIIREDKKILIGGIELEGLDIASFLKENDKCYLMCATVGYEIEREIDKLKTKSPLEQVILDAIGTAAVENLCDKVQNSLGSNLSRFSPGYGDFPLKIQPDIIKLLNAEKLIGVSVSNMLLLTPRKSVTAVIAQKKDYETASTKCMDCKNKNCTYKAK